MLKTLLKAKANTAIDWNAIRRQIEQVNQKLVNRKEINPVDLEKAWARRSAQIVKKIQEEQQGEIIQAAIVSLGDDPL